MSTNGTGATTITGVVAAVNDKGIRLRDELAWHNYSKFATAIVPPERGQAVAITLDGQGFVRTVTPLEAPTDAPQTHDVSRERLIVRQTCITRRPPNSAPAGRT